MDRLRFLVAEAKEAAAGDVDFALGYLADGMMEKFESLLFRYCDDEQASIVKDCMTRWRSENA